MTLNFPTVTNPTDIATRAANSKVNTSQSSGGSFLKMDFDTGEWTSGVDGDDCTGELVIIHTESIAHGWIAWADNSPHKSFVPFDEDLPIKPQPLTDGRGKVKDFQEARRIIGAFADDGEMVSYENNSIGAVKGVSTLLAQALAKAGDGTPFYFPKVKLGSENYPGKGERSGKLNHNPVFEIVAWCDNDGNAEGEAPAQVEGPSDEAKAETEAPTEEPKKRQRRKKNAG